MSGLNVGFVEIEVKLFPEGAVLAGDVFLGDLVLLRKGQVITAQFIEALKSRGISSVRISQATADNMHLQSTYQPTPIIVDNSTTDNLIANDIYAREVEIWEKAGIEQAVSNKLLDEASRCIEDVFSRFKEGKAVELSEARTFVSELIESTVKNPDAAIKLLDVEKHDEYTFRHSVNVGLIFLSLISKQVGRDTLEDLTMGAVFHDIGKTKIPAQILNKPAALTDEEFDLVKKHTVYGYEMLYAAGEFSDDSLDIVRHHHERWDGTGYPDRQEGEAISAYSRLAAVCDVYDALTTSRSYKPRMDFASAMDIIIKGSGKHFAPQSVNKLWTSFGLYPIGSFVKLSNGEIGVVRSLNSEDMSKPIVSILYDRHFHPLQVPKLVNLLSQKDLTISGKITRRRDSTIA